MAYTYDDFVAAANKTGAMNRFSKNDLTVAQRNPEYGMSMLGLMQDISKANTDEQRLLATEAANQMRKNYGVYGTGDAPQDQGYASSYGSAISDLMGKLDNYGSFGYEGQEAYRKLLDSIANQQPFSYDPQADPSWGSYKKAYMREGDRASANALAQASAASGGRASSYAMTAAQQAGNYYAGQLADALPALEQNAYARYLDDLNRRVTGLGALESDRAFDYQDWMTQYEMLQNQLGNYQNQDATDYQRYLDARNQEQQAYERALAQYKLLGYATPEVAAILGIGADAAQIGGRGSTGSGDGGDGSGTGDEEGTANGIDPDTLAQMQLTYPDGVIASKSIWDALTALYGEEALKAAGYSYNAGAGSEAPGKNNTGNGGGAPNDFKPIAFGTKIHK